VEVRERLGDELIDELVAGARTEEEIVGPGGLLADVVIAQSADTAEHESMPQAATEAGAPRAAARGNRQRDRRPDPRSTVAAAALGGRKRPQRCSTARAKWRRC
jgi:hypothetical protein